MIKRYLIELGDAEHELAVEPLSDGRWRVTHGGRTREWDARRVAGTWSMLPVGGGRVTQVDLDEHSPGTFSVTSGAWIGLPMRLSDPLHRSAERAAAARPVGPTEVKSPMPGKVVRALIRVGDGVSVGQPLVVVEAMKMENELKSPRDGKVRELRATDGLAIEAGQTLVVLE